MHITNSATIRGVVTLVLVAGGVAFMPSVQPGVASASSPRSGILHVTKDCSEYTGLAGTFCTITSSNLKALEVGSRIVYLQAQTADGSIDTDIVIRVGPGNAVFGHCDWPATSPTGVCTLAGGTGQFVHFHAHEVVAPVSGNLFSWDGPYSFSPSH